MSNPADAPTPDSQPAPDATAASSTAPTSSAAPSAAGDKKPNSISEALATVALEVPAGETADASKGAESQPAASPAPEAAETEQAGADESDGVKDEPPKEESPAADTDVHFHQRPEWAEAIKIGGDKIKPVLRKLLHGEAQAREQVRSLEPLATATRELKSLVGGDREFDTMRALVRGFAAGDPGVLPLLKSMVETVEKLSGERLTSTDLLSAQARLDARLGAGMMDAGEHQAQVNLLRETEMARAGRKQAESRLQSTSQQQQAQAEQQATQAKAGAINSWETNIRSRDPDFGNVTDVNDSRHGESVADQVFDALQLAYATKPNASTEDLIGAAQRAYTLAKKRVIPAAPRQQRVITSQTSATTGRQRPRNFREAMDAVKLE